MSYPLPPPEIDILDTDSGPGIVAIYGRRDSDGHLLPIKIDDAGKLVIAGDVTLDASDLRIGAVEIQDNDSDTRLDVMSIGDPIVPGDDNYQGILVFGQDDAGTATTFNFTNDGKLKVEASASISISGEDVIAYNEVNSVPSGADTLVATYTVPLNKTFHLRHCMVSGTNIGVFTLKAADNSIAKKRTYFTKFNEDFFFESDVSEGIKLTAGQTVKVYVRHSRPVVGDFNASIYGRLE